MSGDFGESVPRPGLGAERMQFSGRPRGDHAPSRLQPPDSVPAHLRNIVVPQHTQILDISNPDPDALPRIGSVDDLMTTLDKAHLRDSE